MQSETLDGQDVRQQAESAVSTVVDQAQQVAQTKVTTQKERAAETLGAVAQSIRDSSSSLREQQPQIASFVDEAASRVESVSSYIRNHEVGDLIGEAERFARREPLMFLGGAFALGFLASRFIKATAPGGSQGGRSGMSSGQYGDAYPSGAYAGTGYASGGYGYGIASTPSYDQGSVYGQTGESGYAGSIAGASAGTAIASDGDTWSESVGLDREPEFAGAAYATGEGHQDAESAASSGFVTDEAGTTDALADETQTWQRSDSDR
jgi:hypothetical protein